MAYNILILGAAYGSLLASKMLFGGNKIHHVCLPAEADLINSEGFVIRLPVKGRKDPVVLDSRRRPVSIPRNTISSVSQCRSRNTVRRACANCSTQWRHRASLACRS
jgi:hypothetical protein